MRVAIPILLLTVFFSVLNAQSVRWKPKQKKQVQVHLFHSTYALILPTAETLKKGDWEFEVSHHFVPPVSRGEKAFFGLDGPVNNRLALGYALTDDMLLTLGRSNVNAHYDVWLKFGLMQFSNSIFPAALAVRVGGGWNTQVAEREKTHSRNFQYYGQMIVNTMWAKKLALGFVGSFLYNSAILETEIKKSITAGLYLQYYLSDMSSVLLEWNPTVYGWRDRYDSLSFGVELETGGHFFKLFATNNVWLQPAQYLSGADLPIALNNMRLAFMITRVF